MKISKSDKVIIEAVEAGYIATEDGRVFSFTGKELKGCSSGSSPHLKISISNTPTAGSRYPVLKHRFVAYFFYREEIFKHRLIRHLNDVPTDNRIENLLPGSYKDNRSDVPKEKIIAALPEDHVKKLTERNRKLTDKMIKEIREKRKNEGTAYWRLAKEYGVSTMTVHRLCNGVSWVDV